MTKTVELASTILVTAYPDDVDRARALTTAPRAVEGSHRPENVNPGIVLVSKMSPQ